jgi:branched-chain amino acid transport system permease protein
MPDLTVIFASVLNGITTGSIYALVALGLTLIYGVLHIINFAHGSLLMLALYAAFFCYTLLGIDPYLAIFLLAPAFFCIGYLLQRYIIAPIRFGGDQNVLVATVAVAIIIDNSALFFWTSTTRTIAVPYANDVIDLGVALLPISRVVAFFAAVIITLVFWVMMACTDLGRAIRAVSRERHGAQLVGINVNHIYAVSFGIGTAGVAAAACLLAPSFYITPQVGYTFVLIAFTTVVLGGMGSFIGALVGGILLGIVEALSGLYLGESLGQIGIFLIFIVVLLVRPNGLFGKTGGT